MGSGEEGGKTEEPSPVGCAPRRGGESGYAWGMLIGVMLLGAFLVGSVPFGLLIGRLGGVDIRTLGSGNIGATNVWRVLGWRYGLPCFVLDVLKGLAPALGAGALVMDGGVLGRGLTPVQGVTVWMGAGAMAMLGHVFSPWLRFNGGKGVATGFGAMLGMPPAIVVATGVAVVVWLACLWRTRMVGISSCVAAVSMPITLVVGSVVMGGARSKAGVGGWLVGGSVPLGPMLGALVLLAGLVVYTHRANIRRTMKGTENRIGGRGTGGVGLKKTSVPMG